MCIISDPFQSSRHPGRWRQCKATGNVARGRISGNVARGL